MTELEKRELKYTPDKRLVRYRKVLERSRMPENRKQRAIADLQCGIDLENKVIDLCYSVMDRYGKVRASHRLQMRTMARGLVGVIRKQERSVWVERMAESAAHRLTRGLHKQTILEALKACWELLVPDSDEAELAALLKRCEEMGRPPAPRPAPKTSGSGIMGMGQDRISGSEVAAALEQPSDFEEIVRTRATEDLRQALALMKPWARRVVVGKVARRRSYVQLAKQFELRVQDVQDILREARAFVHRYTTFFDDDWYWQDRPSVATSGQ